MKLSIYVPDNLADRLRVVKDELNVSEVCQAAIADLSSRPNLRALGTAGG